MPFGPYYCGSKKGFVDNAARLDHDEDLSKKRISNGLFSRRAEVGDIMRKKTKEE